MDEGQEARKLETKVICVADVALDDFDKGGVQQTKKEVEMVSGFSGLNCNVRRFTETFRPEGDLTLCLWHSGRRTKNQQTRGFQEYEGLHAK